MNFLRLEEVGTVLNLSRSTVYRLVKLGEIPAYKFRGNYRVKQEELDRYLQERKNDKGYVRQRA